ncbi:hypothetical protein P3S68_019879 [Capsicum galapagoense]
MIFRSTRGSPFKTYLVSCAKVRDPRGYSMRASVYEWVFDRHTVVEPVTNNSGMEVSLPLPTKLNTVPFSAIERLRPDLLAVVANCSALQYTADQSKHFREAIVIDQSKKPALFTIWDDLADNEGAKLLHHLHEHPVILAKRIGVTEFRGAIRLATRYQTSILLNPKYVQAATLIKWVEDNEHMLVSYTLRSSLASPSSPNLAPVEDEVFPISTISELSSQCRLSLWKGKYHFLTVCSCFTCSTAHIAITLYASRQKMVHCFNCATLSLTLRTPGIQLPQQCQKRWHRQCYP